MIRLDFLLLLLIFTLTLTTTCLAHKTTVAKDVDDTALTSDPLTSTYISKRKKARYLDEAKYTRREAFLKNYSTKIKERKALKKTSRAVHKIKRKEIVYKLRAKAKKYKLGSQHKKAKSIPRVNAKANRSFHYKLNKAPKKISDSSLKSKLNPIVNNNLRHYGDLDIDLLKRKVLFQGKSLKLTPIEYDIFEYISRFPGRIFSLEQIIENIGKENRFVTYPQVNFHVMELYKKLGPTDFLIKPVQGVVGYHFKNIE